MSPFLSSDPILSSEPFFVPLCCLLALFCLAYLSSEPYFVFWNLTTPRFRVITTSRLSDPATSFPSSKPKLNREVASLPCVLPSFCGSSIRLSCCDSHASICQFPQTGPLLQPSCQARSPPLCMAMYPGLGFPAQASSEAHTMPCGSLSSKSSERFARNRSLNDSLSVVVGHALSE